MTTIELSPPQRRSLRSRASQASGRRFERAMRAGLELAGFTAELTSDAEADGFAHGWDIFVKELPRVVFQCKATKQKHDLHVGLQEARSNANAELWVCFHSYREDGKRPLLRVAYSSRRSGPPSITSVMEFLIILRRAYEQGQPLEA